MNAREVKASFTPSNKNTPKSGVAILVNTKQIYIEQTSTDIREEFCRLSPFILTNNSKLLIYAPSATLNQVQNCNFFENCTPHH